MHDTKPDHQLIEPSQRFGSWVRGQRAGLGLTQEEFGRQCGLDEWEIAIIENGDIYLDRFRATKLAGGLGIPMAEIYAEIGHWWMDTAVELERRTL